ncbi:MAG: aminoglycoside phosphotransferase, partial [Bacteroidales bacterium]|nr:aminoglycoside phosphotransferase [Bacteroidales bacterium]
AIRSLTNTAKEDEKDLKNVSFNFKLFKNFTAGFLQSIQSIIIPEEKAQLAFFALLITYEQALRFYTDYLNGDVYYHINYPEHNLQRSKVHLQLLEDMLLHYEKMTEFINAF